MNRSDGYVTVVVPFYNAEDTLHRCLTSIESQAWHDVSAILVDDGSSDSSRSIAASFADRLGWQLVCADHRGLGPARNEALDRVRTEFVTFLDADDILLPSGIESAVQTAHSTTADMVLCTNHRVGWHGLPSQLPGLAWVSTVVPTVNLRAYESTCLGHYTPTSRLISSKLVRERGVRFRLTDHGEDTVFNVESWVHSDVISACRTPFYLRRPHGRKTPGLTDRRGTLSAVFNRLRAVKMVADIADRHRLSFVRWHNLHVGLGHAFENICMLPVQLRPRGLALLEKSLIALELRPGEEEEYLGVSIGYLRRLDPATVDRVQCRYWVYSNRLERGVRVTPDFSREPWAAQLSSR